jgi:hypothetical protein
MPYRTKVYYLRQEASFPRLLRRASLFVGFAEHVGHQATYKLFRQSTPARLSIDPELGWLTISTESLNLTMTLKTPKSSE